MGGLAGYLLPLSTGDPGSWDGRDGGGFFGGVSSPSPKRVKGPEELPEKAAVQSSRAHHWLHKTERSWPHFDDKRIPSLSHWKIEHRAGWM